MPQPRPSGVCTRCRVLPLSASLTGQAMRSRSRSSCSTTWSSSVGSPKRRPTWALPFSGCASTGSRRRTVPSGRSTCFRSILASSVTVIMLSPPSIAGHATEYTLYVRGPPLRRSLLALSTILVKGFLEVLLSLTFPSTFLGSTFLGRSCVLPIVEENGLEEILVGICRLLGEILG